MVIDPARDAKLDQKTLNNDDRDFDNRRFLYVGQKRGV